MSRKLAQEAASWYFSNIDDYQLHTTNVQEVLREVTVALTASIFASNSNIANDKTDSIKDPAQEVSKGSHLASTSNWRDFLAKKPGVVENENDKFKLNDAVQVYSSFSLRTTARLDAFLLGVCLAVDSSPPPLSASFVEERRESVNPRDDRQRSLGLVEGLAGFRHIESSPTALHSSVTQSFKTNNNGDKKRKPRKQTQIVETELVLRLELYIRTLQRCQHLHRDCVVSAESNRAIKARAQFVVVSFVETVGTVRQQSPVLTRLLTALTQEVLAVPMLSETLGRAILRIVSNYVHTTSFASLAFLSSPENAAEARLKPSVLQYLKYLQQNWQNVEFECDLERMMSSAIDPIVRNTFKTSEFQSIGHLLEVCQGFRNELRSIELPPYNIYDGTSNDVDDAKVKQALRDLQREVITLNGHILPPVNSRTDLIHLLSQTLNSRTLTNPADIASKLGKKKKHKKKAEQHKVANRKHVVEDSDATSESDNQSSQVSDSNDSDYPESGFRAVGPTAAQGAIARRRDFRLSTVDLLTKRLLLAAGRTGTGGDAYFVVRDLFGGPDVEVIPSKNYAINNFYRSAPSSATIDLIVRLTSITIKCHASFDVYPKNLAGETEPLIQVHTTTSETIELQEVRYSDLSEIAKRELKSEPFESLKSGHLDTYSSDESSAGRRIDSDDFGVPSPTVMVVQERKTEKSGYRALSIRPALYEMVEVFNTPS